MDQYISQQKKYQEPAEGVVFDKYWFNKHQSKLLWFANTLIGKKVFGFNIMRLCLKGPISKITPNAISESLGYTLDEKGKLCNSYKAHIFIRNDFARRLYFILYPMWLGMHIWDFFAADYFQLAPNLNFGFSTLTKNPGSIGSNNPVDGQVQTNFATGDPWTFAQLRGGTAPGNGTDTAGSTSLIRIAAATTSNKYEQLFRTISGFDTSSLTSGATISAATLSYIIQGSTAQALGNPGMGVSEATPASNTALANADFGQCLSTSIASDIAWASLNRDDATYNDFALNSTGLAYISKTGITVFSAQLLWDRANDSTGLVWVSGVHSALTLETAKASAGVRPKLVVTYTTPVVYTLTAAKGAFTLTGEATLFHYVFTIVAVKGAYALTGFATAFEKFWKLTAAFGSYVLTGFAANLDRTVIRMIAAAGSYVLTGITVTMKIQKSVVAITGQYVLTGIDVVFRRPVQDLVAVTGQYVLTGFAATPRKIYTLVAALGTYTLTGFASAFEKIWKMTATTGSYVLTGFSIAIHKVITIAAVQGAYVLTGFAANLSRHVITMAADTGHYVLTGMNAALHRVYVALTAVTGSYTLTGVAATLHKRATLIAIRGLYHLTGFAVVIVAPFHTIWKAVVVAATSWRAKDSGE